MAMTLTVSCSMCTHQARELDIAGLKDLDPKTLKKRIEQEGWIVELNGDQMDIYCARTCAE